MYTAAITYTPHLKRIMAFFAAITALSVFLYGIFLLEAVGNTAQRTSAERQVHALTTKVSTLEQAYLSATREMTLERAHSMGFIVPAQVTTIFAVSNTHSLTFGGH